MNSINRLNTQRYWRNGFWGGLLLGLIFVIAFPLCSLVKNPTIDNIVQLTFSPFNLLFDKTGLRLFGIFNFFLHDIITTENVVGYISLLSFWYIFLGFAMGIIGTLMYDIIHVQILKKLISQDYAAVYLGRPVYIVLLYVCAIFVVYGFARKMENYSSFWWAYPFYSWYLWYGIGWGCISLLSMGFVLYLSRKSRRTVWGTCSLIGLFVLLLLSVVVALPPSQNAVCMNNISTLNSIMLDYCKHHGNYPDPDQWCDTLRGYAVANMGFDPENNFVCPYDMRNQSESDNLISSYAMNPSITSSSDQDVVLLYESKAGWNLHGGIELLDTARHRNKGCWITYSNNEIHFVPSNEIDKLKWK